jgi:hypothetical protein
MNSVKRMTLTILLGLLVAAPNKMLGDSGNPQKWYTVTNEADVKDSAVYTAYSYKGGNKYETTVYGRDLEGVSKWNEGSDLPIGMSKIRSIAEQSFRKNFPELKQFKLESINLLHVTIVDDWLFEVTFDGVDLVSASPGPVDEKNLHLLVLLNGKVFMPVPSQGK